MFLDPTTYCAPEFERLAPMISQSSRVPSFMWELTRRQRLFILFPARAENTDCCWRIKNPTGPQRPAMSDPRASSL